MSALVDEDELSFAGMRSPPVPASSTHSAPAEQPLLGHSRNTKTYLGIGLTAFAALNAVVFAVAVAVASVRSSANKSAPLENSLKLTAQDDLIYARTKFPGEVLVMADEFNTLDNSFWRHEINAGGGGNNEMQVYLNNRTNSYNRDGILYLRPNFTSRIVGEAAVLNGGMLDIRGTDPASLCTAPQWDGCLRTSFGAPAILNPVTSARVSTSKSFGFKYGRLEIRARMPRGDWLWPALWLLPVKQAYGIWPASGEIDLAESRGNDRSYPPGGRDWWGSTLHWGPDYSANRYGMTTAEVRMPASQPDLSEGFHIYGLVWNERQLYTYLDVDDQAHRGLSVDFTSTDMWTRGGFRATGRTNPWEGRANNAPFDQEMYIIMNVAVGGGFFPPGVGGRPWGGFADFWNARNTWGPTWDGERAALAVDYVRVWQVPSSGATVWPAMWGWGTTFFGPRLPSNATSTPQPGYTIGPSPAFDAHRFRYYVADYDDNSVLVYDAADCSFVNRLPLGALVPGFHALKCTVAHTHVAAQAALVSVLYVLLWGDAGLTESVIVMLDPDTGMELGRMCPPPGRTFLRIHAAQSSDVLVVVSPPTPGPHSPTSVPLGPHTPGMLQIWTYKVGSLLPHAQIATAVPFSTVVGVGIDYDNELGMIRLVNQNNGDVHEISTTDHPASIWAAGSGTFATLTAGGGRVLFYTADHAVHLHESSGERRLLLRTAPPAELGFTSWRAAAFNPKLNEVIIVGAQNGHAALGLLRLPS